MISSSCFWIFNLNYYIILTRFGPLSNADYWIWRKKSPRRAFYLAATDFLELAILFSSYLKFLG